ncbi:MAG: EboA domain-containing protein [Planctomycetota bacterium]
MTALSEADYNTDNLHMLFRRMCGVATNDRNHHNVMRHKSSCDDYATIYREVYQRRLLEGDSEALGESVLKAAQNLTKLSQLIEVWAMIGAQYVDPVESKKVGNGYSGHSYLMEMPLKDMIKSIAIEAVCREWAGAPEDFTRLLEKLFRTADVREQQLIVRVLPLLKFQERFLRIATEAARTNIVPVFSSLALNNPYPLVHFDENQWNQMVLKAIFVSCDISKIVGLHERQNSSLAETVFQYISERHSAQRSVPRNVVEHCEQALSDTSRLKLNAIKPLLREE